MIGVFTKTKELLAPVSGRVIQSRQNGIVIIPSDTRIYAPAAGVISVKSGKGTPKISFNARMLELSGGFKTHIKNGSRVKAGDVIAAIDLDLLKNGGYMTKVFLMIQQNGTVKQVDSEWVRGGESIVFRLL